ncbi:hypothetical protein EOA37_09685 [Mesorhizobium sp. M2A.F.Ca.ET.015.02.1.1]|uniref:hypothetical protein n=1 Tax=Mesorhizobium sp. M2A.F.Ca.ET.015.02.1.1 TaxID=2496758 RepID=UPI000FCA354D|nr:hypothetical protein [Mesorhizobium sp. M2A.F.Ca.ET.015.02.1.1]RUW41522.1 hypothetical protein EOA37_09685 [Mesorhizobium sp. M2A.F.Ca.ET.015.02.1.1]
MKPYEPRPAGRHVRKTPDGKLVRQGDFTDPDATAAPAAEQPKTEEVPTAGEPATAPKTKGK